jgi:hypothetical protein
MNQITHKETGNVFNVAAAPRLVAGVWECGDRRFVDPTGEDYEPTPQPMLPMAFYLAFTPAERIQIKTSTDPVVQEFWATYLLAEQTGTPIDPGLVSVTAGLQYLRDSNILQSDERIADILMGVPQ